METGKMQLPFYGEKYHGLFKDCLFQEQSKIDVGYQTECFEEVLHKELPIFCRNSKTREKHVMKN